MSDTKGNLGNDPSSQVERKLTLTRNRFGTTGLEPSRIGLGAMELAGPPRAPYLSETEATRLLHAALDMGINYFDTSIDYGKSEEVIGAALSKHRDKFILATKCGCQVGVEAHGEGSHVYTPDNIRAGVEQSLRRLKTDHIDVMQLHGNPTREMLESQGGMEALLELKRKGVIGHIGLSSRKPYLKDFLDIEAFEVFQIPYSAIQRQHEDIIETVFDSNRATVVRGAVARGSAAKAWKSIPIGMKDGQAQSVWEGAGLDQILDGMPPVEFMIRFALTNPKISLCLTGSSNIQHLIQNVEAANKGPLPSDLYNESLKRLEAAGSAPGDPEYARGGPKPPIT
jgi:aryl-alcohol dehydrogenase-like predicted oxidoreductase